MADLSITDTHAHNTEATPTAENLITTHLDIWTTAIEQKSSAGRGSSKKFSLYGIKKLRELILELAVRGKLVPQASREARNSANYEPASVLLERIAAEKAQLVKEGKLKKQKPLPEISDDEKPFELPNGWEWSRLSETGLGSTGKTPSTKQSSFFDGNIPFIGPGQITPAGIVLKAEKFLSQSGLGNSCEALPGDIFMVCIGGSIGKAAIVVERSGFNQQINCISPLHIASKYLYFALSTNSFHSSVLEKATGSATPIINRGKWEELPVPIAPLEEQHRIVAKVDELMSLCDALEAQTEASISAHQILVETLLNALLLPQTAANTASQSDVSLERPFTNSFVKDWQRVAEHFDTLFTTSASIDTLKQTILQLAVMGKLVKQDPNDEPAAKLLARIAKEKAQLIKEGKIKKQKPQPAITEEEKPFELPSGWAWVKLNALITIMDAGWSPACPPEASPSNEVWGVLKTTAVQSMEYREYENKVLSESKEPRHQYEVKVGDILITRAGPKNRVGVSCLVQKTRPKLMISDKIIRFHLIETGMSERFISLCLNAGATAEFLETAKSGMAESQMNISQDKLKAAPIPLAPREEQHRIVAKVDELMALCDQLKVCLADAQITQLHLTDAIVEQAI
ncbi:restriction endonuclease subunit S [Shewanella sp. 1180_01]|uniref:restriction endonuclease subunit S n=1 Tax=Shewanella sp. 1180_01 TaxID=2604451 RepID=UPI0040635621